MLKMKGMATGSNAEKCVEDLVCNGVDAYMLVVQLYISFS